ncbi:MAG TPA: prolyl oligopeptidase family serine peptidase [Polyangia bacterium]
MTIRWSLPLTLAALLSLPARADNLIHFKDRTIDLDLYLQGYPYSSPYVDLRAGKMFYRHKGKTDELMMTSFDVASKDKVDLSRGRVISPRDFSKRSWWGAAWSPATKTVLIQADEKNDEIMNLYSLDPETGVEKRLTNTSYIYGWELSHDGRRVAYVTRATKDEMSPADVRVLDLATGAEKIVYKDSPAQKIVWTGIAWQPNEHGLLVSYNGDGDRHHRNLLYVPIVGKAAPRVVSDPKTLRYDDGPLNEWISNDEYLFTSDESGVESVYRASLSGGAPVRVTADGENVKGAVVLRDGARRRLVVVSGNPMRSTVAVIDPATGAVKHETKHDEMWWLDVAHGNRSFVTVTSLSIPFSAKQLNLHGDDIELIDRVAYPDELLRKIVNCDVEKVGFRTFDNLAAPGEDGTLHAYLLEPKQPRAKGELRALVLSFYGGYNDFWTEGEILCQAGYYVMSPAPRGSSDFGTKFFDLAAGDWGGAETLDDFAAGKFLRDRLGIPAQRIGIFGHSRGGYDTMRAMTFPGEVNGVKETFRFGFGIAESGISDIIRAAKGGNISQWYANLTGGDPSKDAAKWIDRSPESHADRISGPLLLTHGSSDMRVPVTESRAMFEKLKKLKKEVYYTELAGQGHGYVGIDALSQYYRALFDFLGKLP